MPCIEIDTTAGTVLRRLDVPGAIFLNDVTANEDTVWISDTVAGAIYMLSKDAAAVVELVKDPKLNSINGILIDGDKIIGGTIGDFQDPTDLGNLVTISLQGSYNLGRKSCKN